ncbi:MAG: hypothetical protein CVU98_11340 [Firmicutes bacterium HGW-Firmicutes-3]|jgi:hypothetical protein|nr:MAG: hypothetical protein CVU98_11340 [Firmicutes bacterium HGW-Firmicutes-3]
MINNSKLNTIKFFNDKSLKIVDSEYVRNLVDGKVSMSLKRDGYVVVDPEVTVPDNLYIESFLLSLRFFIQDNEDISIRNLSKIYNDVDVEQSLKKRFNDSRNWLLKYLKCKCFVEQDGQCLTRLQVFEYFIYGEFAHSTKKSEFEKLKDNKIYFGIYRYTFNEVLLMYIKTIKEIVAINEDFIRIYGT